MTRRARGGPRFANEAADRPSADARARARELDGSAVFEEPDAADWNYSFLPPECECSDRCLHRPEVVRISRCPNRPLRAGFVMLTAADRQCGHSQNGIAVDGCPGCAVRSRPERLPTAA